MIDWRKTSWHHVFETEKRKKKAYISQVIRCCCLMNTSRITHLWNVFDIIIKSMVKKKKKNWIPDSNKVRSFFFFFWFSLLNWKIKYVLNIFIFITFNCTTIIALLWLAWLSLVFSTQVWQLARLTLQRSDHERYFVLVFLFLFKFKYLYQFN